MNNFKLSRLEGILILITVPEFFPIIRLEVKVITSKSHPNIDEQMNLSLQFLMNGTPYTD